MILDDLTYERVTGADGRPMWRFSDGTTLPVVRGGSGESEGGAGEGEGAGESGEGEGGAGDGGESGEGGAGDGASTAEDVAKWKALARKHEAESKKARAETDKLRKAGQTDSERAISEAEARGRQAATADVAQRLAGAEIKAALTGVVPDPAAIVEDLNLAKYIGDDGEVNSEAVAELRKKFEALSKGSKGGNVLRQGQTGQATDKGQLTQAELSKMTPAQIVQARRDGRLAGLQSGVGRTADYS